MQAVELNTEKMKPQLGQETCKTSMTLKPQEELKENDQFNKGLPVISLKEQHGESSKTEQKEVVIT